MEALRLQETSDRSISAVERELGIGQGCLARWKREFAAVGAGAFPGQGHRPAEQERLRQLERENEILRQERDILKKQWPSSRAQTHEIPVHRQTS